MGESKRRKQAEETGGVRLALRIEGIWWVAYMARTDTMEGAMELGRVLYNAAERDQRLRDGFKLLMRGLLASALEAVGTPAVSWSEEKAPESERAGRA